MAQTNTQTSTIPPYISDPTKSALTDIQNWLKSPSNYTYGTKPGESLFTPMSQSQNEAIGNINWLSDQNLSSMFGLDKAGGLYDQFSSFQPGMLSPEKVTDQNGYLGSIQGYMDPYLDQVLDPQIRRANDQLQVGRRDLDANQAMAGAFGDARHGVTEGQLYDDTQRNITDLTGQTYSNAWNNAMGLRQGDIATKLGVDAGNRDALIQQNANKATAAQGVAGLGQLGLKNTLDVNDALFNAGQVEHDNSEEQRQAIQNFQEALKNKDYDSAMKLLGAVRGAPYTTNTTSTQKSDDGMWGLIGSLLGGVAGAV